jgi:hypothetical protein
VLSYDLLLKLLLKHKSHSHSSFLLEFLSYIITLINTSNITRTRQAKHIKNTAKAITVTEVFREALKIIIALKAIAVSEEAKAIANISRYLHAKRSIISVTNQVISQQNTLLKIKSKRIASLVSILFVFIRNL